MVRDEFLLALFLKLGHDQYDYCSSLGRLMAHIAVFEDDYAIRDLVQKVLSLQGHTVEAFEDAAPILDLGNVDAFDLMVTDLAMPTPGEVVIRTLRQRGVDVPILVMSGHADSEKATYLIQLGANAVIAKPFLLNEFVAVVRGLLE